MYENQIVLGLAGRRARICTIVIQNRITRQKTLGLFGIIYIQNKLFVKIISYKHSPRSINFCEQRMHIFADKPSSFFEISSYSNIQAKG